MTNYKWVAEDDHLVCFESTSGSQHDTPLQTADKMTRHHDASLAQATSEINEILDRVRRDNSNEDVEPCLITLPEGKMMLVWAKVKKSVSLSSSPEDIARILGVKAESISR
ncbi:hypothetical protein [Streptomyces sp. NPDC058701]|uniref:hypothetical protein n=1 Tax=Streptomyces sp. NPDC058701 TaxID=3346608 RepID=UPI0036659346